MGTRQTPEINYLLINTAYSYGKANCCRFNHILQKKAGTLRNNTDIPLHAL